MNQSELKLRKIIRKMTESIMRDMVKESSIKESYNAKELIAKSIWDKTLEDDRFDMVSQFVKDVAKVEEYSEMEWDQLPDFLAVNLIRHYSHNEIRENEEKTEFDIKDVRNKISSFIEKTKMESRIETGYAYWIDANRLGRLLKNEFGKDITMEIDRSVYLSTGAMPAQKFYDSKKDRDNNAKKLIQLYSLAYKSRGFN